jgi:hypothetical protein
MGCNRCNTRHNKLPKKSGQMVNREFRFSDHRRKRL